MEATDETDSIPIHVQYHMNTNDDDDDDDSQLEKKKIRQPMNSGMDDERWADWVAAAQERDEVNGNARQQVSSWLSSWGVQHDVSGDGETVGKVKGIWIRRALAAAVQLLSLLLQHQQPLFLT